MKNKNRIIYSLNVEDIQTVAQDELDRELTEDEIKEVSALVGEYIDWYDAILQAINAAITPKAISEDE